MNEGTPNGASRKAGLSGCIILVIVCAKCKFDSCPSYGWWNKNELFVDYIDIHDAHWRKTHAFQWTLKRGSDVLSDYNSNQQC